MVGEGVAVNVDNKGTAPGRLDERDVSVVAHGAGDVGVCAFEPLPTSGPWKFGAHFGKFVRGSEIYRSVSHRGRHALLLLWGSSHRRPGLLS